MIIQADLLRWLPGNQWLYQAEQIPKFHGVFCDPPYFLGSISKRFGPGQKAAQYGKDGLYQRQSRGFMGKTWDGFDSLWHYQAWVTEWASMLLDFAYPGAFGLFYGGTRTFHRLTAGIEDAGWEIADCLMYMYGSGFPKSHNQPGGYGSALKPAYEPLIVARAPRGKYTYAELFQKWGVGSFNIDGGRIATDEVGSPRDASERQDRTQWRITGGTNGSGATSNLGRWPSNIIIDDAMAALLDAQSGERKAGGNLTSNEPSSLSGGIHNGGVNRQNHEWESYADSGGASRFFYTAKAASWEREAGLDDRDVTPRSQARPNSPDLSGKFPDHDTRKRRNTHPTVKPIALNEYFARLILPPVSIGERRLLVPFAGVGSEVIGATLAGWEVVTGIERESEYVEQGRARVAWWSQFKNYEQAKSAYEGERKADKREADGQLPLFAESVA